MKTYPIFTADDLTPTETEVVAEDALAEGEEVLGKDEHLALWAAEARRRLEDFRSGKSKAIPVDEAFASIRRELELR